MKFPIDEQKFINRWLSALNDPDEGDREQAEATVQTINRAYYAGLEASHRSCDAVSYTHLDVYKRQRIPCC